MHTPVPKKVKKRRKTRQGRFMGASFLQMFNAYKLPVVFSPPITWGKSWASWYPKKSKHCDFLTGESFSPKCAGFTFGQKTFVLVESKCMEFPWISTIGCPLSGRMLKTLIIHPWIPCCQAPLRQVKGEDSQPGHGPIWGLVDPGRLT